MTQLLETAFARAAALPSEEQDAFAKLLLAELDSEVCWADLFGRSHDLLAELAAEAVADHRAGRTRPLDPDAL